jgi:RimJ/RimL family protein N-acetyltransferase
MASAHGGDHAEVMDVLLSTARLTLRRFTPDDADLLTDLDSDPDVMFWITGGRPTPRTEIIDDVLPAFLDYYRNGDRWGFWAVEERATGKFVGWFHLRPGEHVHTASRRVMEKVGMRLVRTFFADWPDHIPGDEHGDVEYAVTRNEWAARINEAER